MDAIKERKLTKGIISTTTRYIHSRSLTFQFLEKQASLVVGILERSINDVNGEDHLNVPRGLQDEGVRVDDVEAGNDLPHNAAEGFQDDDAFAFDFQIDQLFSPPREPGLIALLGKSGSAIAGGAPRL
jgi:hypothetical protein